MEAKIIELEQQIDPLVAADNHYKMMVAFVKQQMERDIDYGVIPGTNNKPVLLKPGAEKLCRLFSLYPQLELIQSVVDFEKPLFHYHYRCTIYRHGEPVGQGEGCCNSKEKKYEKQVHKIYDLTNTICKIAQKRAMVSAVLVAVGASQFFTCDLEDIEPDEKPTQKPTQKPTPSSANLLIEQTTVELKRLGWTVPQGRLYLQETYNKTNRSELTETELRLFLEHLRSL